MSTELTGKQERAALLIAEDELTMEAIAQALSVTVRTIYSWKRLPAVQDRVRSHITQLGQELSRYAIARRDKRVAEYQRRWDAIQQVRAERATDETMRIIAGGSTGIVVRTYKQVGQDVVAEYAVDNATMAEQRALEKQAAQEAGQWSEKQEHAVDIMVRRYIGVDLDAV